MRSCINTTAGFGEIIAPLSAVAPSLRVIETLKSSTSSTRASATIVNAMLVADVSPGWKVIDVSSGSV